MIIDDLPSISIANDSDEIAIEQGTATKKITKGNFLQEVTSAISSLLSSLSGKVSKAGDTMTGALFVERNVNADAYHAAKTTLYSINEPPASSTHTLYSLVAYDKDSNIIGYLRDYIGTDGSTGIDLNARNLVNGSGYTNGISLTMKPDGTRGVGLSDPVAWRTALGVASYTEGTWTPKLYDYNTYLKDLPSQSYYKIGNFYICRLYLSAFPETTFKTMIQIRNLPCISIGSSPVYAATSNGQGGNWTTQPADTAIYLRPNFVGTISGGIFNVLIFGTD